MLQKGSRVLRVRGGIVLQLALATLFWPGLISAQNPPPVATDGCAISGHILNRGTGESVHAATVDLTDASKMVANLANTSYMIFGRGPKSTVGGLTTRSLDDGTFCFQSVPAGQYLLNASKLGFLESSYGAKGYLELGPSFQLGAHRYTRLI
jgi:hypothetical protein